MRSGSTPASTHRRFVWSETATNRARPGGMLTVGRPNRGCRRRRGSRSWAPLAATAAGDGIDEDGAVADDLEVTGGRGRLVVGVPRPRAVLRVQVLQLAVEGEVDRKQLIGQVVRQGI